MITENFKVMEHDRLEKLIKELSNNITDKTNYEKELFNKIDNIINLAKTKSNNIRKDYGIALASLMSLGVCFIDNKIECHDHNDIRGMKFCANRFLENIPSQVESHNLKEIAKLSMKISHNAKLIF